MLLIVTLIFAFVSSIFIYKKSNGDRWIGFVGVAFGFVVSAISAALLLVSIGSMIVSRIGVEGKLEAEKMRYESLVSQAENHLYDSDNNIGKKELADDIREWNEDLAKYKKMKEDIWLKDFYPMDVSELEFIPNDILK